MISKVIPWGRSLEEYRGMFSFSVDELKGKKILDCAAGPASFNAEAAALGINVISADPIYASIEAPNPDEQSDKVKIILNHVENNVHNFRWDFFKSPEHLIEHRLDVFRKFTEHFKADKARKKYVADELPGLSFKDKSFDLALCSHLLFLYSHVFDADFHISSIREMLRVAGEVRIFPLQGMDFKPSPFLKAVTDFFSKKCDVKILEVPYEFRRGANRMLVVKNRAELAD